MSHTCCLQENKQIDYLRICRKGDGVTFVCLSKTSISIIPPQFFFILITEVQFFFDFVYNLVVLQNENNCQKFEFYLFEMSFQVFELEVEQTLYFIFSLIFIF